MKNILFPTDFSRCANQALLPAIWLAEHIDVELHVLHVTVLDEVNPFGWMHYVRDREEVAERLEHLALRDMGTAIETHILPRVRTVHLKTRDSSPAPEIIRYAREHEIDLITIGTHGRRGLERILIGSVAEDVLREAPCSVLTVPLSEEPRLPGFRKLLVPTDFSENARWAIDFAMEIAKSLGAHVHFMHAMDDAMLLRIDPGLLTINDFSVSVRPAIEKRLEALAKEVCSAGISCSYSFGTGRAAHAIEKTAREEDIDAIILARRGTRSGRGLGRVPERVVRIADRPVFVVHA